MNEKNKKHAWDIKNPKGNQRAIILKHLIYNKTITSMEAFSKYRITRLNIFEEDVFDDTSYTVCSFQFEKQDLYPLIPPYTKINTFIYPSQENIELILDSSNKFTIGKTLFPNIKSEYNVRRLVVGNKPTTNLYLRAIDTGTDDGRICLSINENHLYGSSTDRTFCTIQTDKKIKDEQMVCDNFNRLLEKGLIKLWQ